MSSGAARVVPVGVLKAFAAVLLLVWTVFCVMAFLLDWQLDGPSSQRAAYGLFLGAGLGLVMAAGALWRIAVGLDTMDVSDVRYYFGALVLMCGLYAFGIAAMLRDTPLGNGLLVAVIVSIAVAMAGYYSGRARRRRTPQVSAPIIVQSVQTQAGERHVRIAQPQRLGDQWSTMWSVGTSTGTGTGALVRVSYGPDPMTSLATALADAEAATVVL